jgi:hypothetical protein
VGVIGLDTPFCVQGRRNRQIGYSMAPANRVDLRVLGNPKLPETAAEVSGSGSNLKLPETPGELLVFGC